VTSDWPAIVAIGTDTTAVSKSTSATVPPSVAWTVTEGPVSTRGRSSVLPTSRSGSRRSSAASVAVWVAEFATSSAISAGAGTGTMERAARVAGRHVALLDDGAEAVAGLGHPFVEVEVRRDGAVLVGEPDRDQVAEVGALRAGAVVGAVAGGDPLLSLLERQVFLAAVLAVERPRARNSVSIAFCSLLWVEMSCRLRARLIAWRSGVS
jgi:hypothetical protein